jgi:hypothetical protein
MKGYTMGAEWALKNLSTELHKLPAGAVMVEGHKDNK